MTATVREQFYQGATERAFYTLCSVDQEIIDELVTRLKTKVPGMGTKGAMELLSKLGVFLSKETHEQEELLKDLEIKYEYGTS